MVCRWLAYQGKSIYLDELLYQPNNSLIVQSMDASKAVTPVNGDGFGAAWYEEKATPGVYHEILPAWSDENLRSLSEHIHSHRFMAHVRASTGGNTSRLNCHPFQHDNWLFMHNGQIPEFEKVRFDLEHTLTEQYYLKRVGTTDSELIFLMLLQAGLALDPKYALMFVIAEIETCLSEKMIDEPFKASLCFSDGRQFWGLRYATNNESPPSMFYRKLKRGFVLSSEPYDNESGQWHPIPAQSYVAQLDDEIMIVPFFID